MFDRYPELGRAVHTLNLSAPTKDAKTSKETFRRAAGLVRATPVVKDISLLHVRLTDKVSMPPCQEKPVRYRSELEQFQRNRFEIVSFPHFRHSSHRKPKLSVRGSELARRLGHDVEELKPGTT